MEPLVFSTSPAITVATNTFVNVPTILQYEDTPLIEVIRTQEAGFAMQIPIYHSDGTYLAKVVGSRLFCTPEGKDAGLTLEYPDKMTVCKQEGRVLFEIRRQEAAALSTEAELYAPNGCFVRTSDKLAGLELGTNGMSLGRLYMSGNLFSGCRIGIWIRGGGVSLGVS